MNRQPSAKMRFAAAIAATGALALGSSQLGLAAAATPADYPAAAIAAPPADQLDQLVAPIALYPDQLVAEILAAATYPAEVVEADRWLRTHSGLQGDTLAEAVNAQRWDGSVKAMAPFPQVLAMMDKNLSWTVSLGGAYARDAQSVMSAIQKMRARAERAGNLESTPQENVTTEGQTIVIEPSDADVVYVPDYDPWLVYGDPIVLYPGWVPIPGLFIGGTGMYFGLGATLGIFGGFGWGWDHWRPDWHGHGVDFDHHPYVPHGLAGVHDRSGSFGHPAAFGRPGEFSHGVGFTGGFHPDTVRQGPAGFAGDRFATPGGFAHPAAPARFALGGRAGFGGFHAAMPGSFHGGGAHFGGAHAGGGHR